MKLSKSGTRWAKIYLSILLAYALVGILAVAVYSQASLLIGLIGIVLTLPTSLIFTSILDSLGYIAWYDQFVHNPALYALLAMLGLLPGALVNAGILYFLGSKRRQG